MTSLRQGHTALPRPLPASPETASASFDAECPRMVAHPGGECERLHPPPTPRRRCATYVRSGKQQSQLRSAMNALGTSFATRPRRTVSFAS